MKNTSCLAFAVILGLSVGLAACADGDGDDADARADSLTASSSAKAAQLKAKCTLHVASLNPDGTKKVEPLAPGGAIERDVTISTKDGELPMTEISFDAPSPDGVISVQAQASASSLFGKSFSPILNLTARLVAKDIVIRSPNPFLADGELDDKDWRDERSLHFSIGTTPDGFAVRAYSAACEMKIAQP